MKTITKGASCLLISWAAVWLIGSFILWELDPSEWGMVARFVFVLSATGFGLIAFAASLDCKS